MQALSLSGGSTKIAGIAGAAVTICQIHGYHPKYITGISAGSIIAVPLAMGMFDEIKTLTTTITSEMVFKINPLNRKGKPSGRGLRRAIVGCQSLGVQNLKATLSKIITPDIFAEYKNGPEYAKCYLGAVEFRTGAKHYFDVKKGTHQDYLNAMAASASIPVFVESVPINGVTTHNQRKIGQGFWMDGGTRDHVGSHWLMKQKDDITEHISVYSRPKDFKLPDETKWVPGGVVSMLTRSLDILNTEKSKNDEFMENVVAKANNIKTRQVFLDISETIGYDMDPVKLRGWYNKAVTNAHGVMNTPWREPEDIQLEIGGQQLSIS
ncbi:MAG: patatin-like phospholipase family protein [Flavobacteriales bacterium]|nr:patatin-like phospholipase family protein [Flavobacteriales bacterium]